MSDERLGPVIYPQADVVLVRLPLDTLVRERSGDALDVLTRYLATQLHFQQAKRLNSAVVFIVGCRKDLIEPEAEPCLRSRSELVRYAAANVGPKRSSKKDAKALQKMVKRYLECSATTGEGMPQLLDVLLKAPFESGGAKPRKFDKKCVLQ